VDLLGKHDYVAAVNSERGTMRKGGAALGALIVLALGCASPTTTPVATAATDTTSVRWEAFNSTLMTDAAHAPDGTMSAEKLTEDGTAASAHSAFATPGIPITPGQTVTMSCYLKAGTRTKAQVGFVNGNNGTRVKVDLATGALISAVAVGSGTIVAASVGVIPAVKGWYRVTVAGSPGGAFTTGFVLVHLLDDTGGDTYNGDGVGFLYVWGAQVASASVVTVPPYLLILALLVPAVVTIVIDRRLRRRP
jgi:hypothetical protein